MDKGMGGYLRGGTLRVHFIAAWTVADGCLHLMRRLHQQEKRQAKAVASLEAELEALKQANQPRGLFVSPTLDRWQAC